MKISIVIRARNEEKGLRKLLPALQNQDQKDLEIIVVDDHSTDETLAVARSFGARVISLGENKFSYGKALNLGFAQASGEVIVSVPGHGMPESYDWLSKLIKPFSDPKVAATYGSQKAYPDANFLEKLERFWVGNIDFNRLYPYLVNTNSAIRKSVWEENPFNEIVNANEDHLWALQVGKKGYRVVLVKDAKFRHSHTGSVFKTLGRFGKEATTYIKIRLGVYG